MMTGKQRVRALFAREPVDTMPLFSGMGAVTMQAIDELGYQFAAVHADAEKLARAAIRTAETFDFDGFVVPLDMCTVPEALGRGASLYESADEILYPTVPQKWASVDEIDLPDDFDVIFARTRMPLVDEALRICLEHDNGRFAVGGWVLGPFTMAGQLLELDVLLKGLRKDADRVAAFLGRMTDLVIAVARHYQDLGVDYVTIREMGTGTDIISPRMWRAHVGPNMTKVFDALDAPSVNHICGSTDLIIEMMHATGADAVSVDQKNDVAATREKLGPEALILGNFDPYGTLVTGQAEAVPAAIEKCISDGVDAVWPGCDIWPAAGPDHMRAFVQTVRDMGRRATPAVGRL
jgi:[methyl-Co(III) methanol-specific corrinoid protein]:coenzyme M methyltransferase